MLNDLRPRLRVYAKSKATAKAMPYSGTKAKVEGKPQTMVNSKGNATGRRRAMSR